LPEGVRPVWAVLCLLWAVYGYTTSLECLLWAGGGLSIILSVKAFSFYLRIPIRTGDDGKWYRVWVVVRAGFSPRLFNHFRYLRSFTA
jgi:hypothetical protein